VDPLTLLNVARAVAGRNVEQKERRVSKPNLNDWDHVLYDLLDLKETPGITKEQKADVEKAEALLRKIWRSQVKKGETE
jgi:hypothetical protein